MFNDEEKTTETAPEEQAPEDPSDIPGSHIIIFVDDSGEVQVATKGRKYHPEEITKMLGVVTAKIELLQFQVMLEQAMAHQRAQANPLLIARRGLGDLDL